MPTDNSLLQQLALAIRAIDVCQMSECKGMAIGEAGYISTKIRSAQKLLIACHSHVEQRYKPSPDLYAEVVDKD